MSYGLQTFNPTGNIQIDSRFESIVELTRGEFPKIQSGSWGDVYGGNLPIQYTTNPKWLLLLQPTGKFTTSTRGDFHEASPYNSGRVSFNAEGQTLKWVIGVPESETGEGNDDDYGISVWDAEGNRVFNSAHYTIIPERVVSYTPLSIEEARFIYDKTTLIDVILPPLPENWEYYVNHNSVGPVFWGHPINRVYHLSWTSLEFITNNHLRITQTIDTGGGGGRYHTQGPRTLVVYKVRTLN